VPRPRSLTSDRIADAALAVVDRAGLHGLSMRAVAAELGTGTMSLYRYVEGRQHLEDLIVEHTLGAIDVTVPAGIAWADRVRLLCERARTTVGARPDLVALVLMRRHAVPASRRWGEAVLAALADGGLAGEERAIALRTLMAYVLGAVQVEHFGPLAGPGTLALADDPATYPLLAEAATSARPVPPAEEFARGLDTLLRGLTRP
jgi:AcrR family transcriptional regulator